MKLPILYMDNHLLVVNKPAGLLSQGDSTGDPSVLSLGKAYLKETFEKPGNVYLGLLHRLDRPTSGVMVLARTSKCMRRLSEQFRKREIEKCYVAIVEGTLNGQGCWKDYLLKKNRTMYVVSDSAPPACHAVLEWLVLAYHENLTLVHIRLITGRRHQIRCQFAHRGFPLLGDMRYGARRMFDGRNLALHSYRLIVDHPIQKEEMTFQAPVPYKWGDVWNKNWYNF